jgi:hypothetical protein
VRTSTVILFSVLLGAFLFGCSSSTEELAQDENPADAIDGGSAVRVDESDSEPDWTGAQLNRYDLRVGNCFSEWSWFDEQFDRRINITASVDCGETHLREVFHEAEFPAPNGAPFPGETKMTEWSTDLCYGAFADFVGLEYELSVYGIDFIQPTQETFEHPVGRHRRVTCILYNVDEEELVGSARLTAL